MAYTGHGDSLCPHGNRYYCGLCASDQAVHCAHGNAFYCGFCGGRVTEEGQSTANPQT